MSSVGKLLVCVFLCGVLTQNVADAQGNSQLQVLMNHNCIYIKHAHDMR